MHEFWRQKLWDLDFVQMNSGNIHIEESKEPGFNFSIKLRINSRFFRVISWSNRLCLTMLWAIMTHNDTMTQNIHTMTHCDLKYGKLFYNDPNKVLGLLMFLNFVPKILFWGQTWPSFNQVLKLDTKKYLRLPKSTIIFLNFVPKTPFLGGFGRKSSQCFA